MNNLTPAFQIAAIVTASIILTGIIVAYINLI